MAESKEDDALNICLVKFVNTFSGELTTGPCKTLADLSNGVMLFELLSLLAPAHFDMDDITKETAGNAILEVSNVTTLLKRLESFFEDVFERKTDFSSLSPNSIARDKNKADLAKLLELVILAAINSVRKEDAISNIMAMEETEQQRLRLVINDVMERFGKGSSASTLSEGDAVLDPEVGGVPGAAQHAAQHGRGQDVRGAGARADDQDAGGDEGGRGQHDGGSGRAAGGAGGDGGLHGGRGEGQFPAGTGGVLAASRAALEKEMQKDALARSMDQRPTHESLVAAGVAGDRSVAPALQSVARKLERNMLVDSLNQQLYAREDVEKLKARDVMRGGDIAPSLRSTRLKLEKAMTRDKVSHMLEQRHSHDDLVHRGIVQPKSTGSRIAGVARKLQHTMTQDRVGHLLEKRTDIETLERRGIAKDTHLASSLHQSARHLQRNLARSNLYHALRNRPSLAELRERKIYIPDEDYEAGEISLQAKGYLKDLIVDQDKSILSVAEAFDAENDVTDFKESLIVLAEKAGGRA